MCCNVLKTLIIYVFVTSVCTVYQCIEDPKISVVGNVLKTVRSAKLLNPGDPVDIYCTCSNAKIISKREYFSEIVTEVKTEVVNETTIKHSIGKMLKEVVTFTCQIIDTPCKDEVQLVSDTAVELQNFQCVSHNVIYVNCSWSLNNELAQVKLYVQLDNKDEKICEIPADEYRKEMFCVWDSRRRPKYSEHLSVELKFLLIVCNLLGCIEEPFTFEHVEIVQIDPPVNLRAINVTKNTAVLQWKAPDTRIIWSILRNSTIGLELHNKVEIWHHGFDKHEVDLDNMTMVGNDGMTCQMILDLPCPDTTYEVKVLNKLKNALWSDFSRMYFSTDKDPDNVVVEANCNKPKVPLTKEIMAYKLNELEIEFKKKLTEMKTALSVFKLRVENINEQKSQ